ncbi:hypothetical protein IWW37_003858 [Coemansia sp. RSA 2050]|nr:hypothetical protein IWW37_003858 [Coemansia sp. RSA 2050]
MANDHDWAVFLAPADTQGRMHLANEPYYFERNNEITTWIRPFDYIEPIESPLSVGESWQREQGQRKLQQARALAKADRPQAQALLGGSEWKRVTTVQGREYFYNTKTQLSQWEYPQELDSQLDEEKGGVVEEGTEMTADDVEWMLAQMDEDQEEEYHQVEDEDETETKAAMVVDDLPKEERVAQFKAMLRDIGVNPFGTWEAQINSYEADSRFTLIEAPLERRELFDI